MVRLDWHITKKHVNHFTKKKQTSTSLHEQQTLISTTKTELMNYTEKINDDNGDK